MKLWKVQKFFGDILYDLRQRNLLLVAILLVVGIIAAPILIAKGTGSESAPPSLASQSTSGVVENQPAVLAYSPAGIRSYKRRLDALPEKNPFKQQFANSAEAAAAATGATGGGAADIGLQATEIIPGVGGAPTAGGGPTKTVTKTKTKTKTKYVYYQTDVQVGEANATLTSLTNIPQFTALPSSQVPVLIFLGTSSGGSQAIFMVAKDVASVGGEGLCYPSQDACQLLALAAGKGADLIYNVDHKTYHVQVTRIKRVTSSKPPA